jgi:hypothetical protein
MPTYDPTSGPLWDWSPSPIKFKSRSGCLLF